MKRALLLVLGFALPLLVWLFNREAEDSNPPVAPPQPPPPPPRPETPVPRPAPPPEAIQPPPSAVETEQPDLPLQPAAPEVAVDGAPVPPDPEPHLPGTPQPQAEPVQLTPPALDAAETTPAPAVPAVPAPAVQLEAKPGLVAEEDVASNTAAEPGPAEVADAPAAESESTSEVVSAAAAATEPAEAGSGWPRPAQLTDKDGQVHTVDLQLLTLKGATLVNAPQLELQSKALLKVEGLTTGGGFTVSGTVDESADGRLQLRLTRLPDGLKKRMKAFLDAVTAAQ